MAPSRPALVHPEPFLAMNAEHARALLAALKAPPAVLRANADAPSLARALFVGAFPRPLTAWLDRVVALASPLGRRALVQAAGDVGGVDAAAWADERPEDLAASVVRMAARGEASAERCVERALLRLARLLPDRVGYELVARRPPPALDAGKLAAALSALPRGHGEPWIAEDDGALHAAVRWRDAGVCPDRVLVDLVSVERATGRVSIESADPSRVAVLKSALADALFEDARAFQPRPAFTLKPVIAAGSEGLGRAVLPAPVKRAAVVACQLLTKDGERFEGRSKDAIGFAAKLMATLGGYASRATFRFEIEGARAPVDAYVELPNILGVRDARYLREVRAALAALGVFAPGAVADDVPTLAYAAEPEWRWREVAGDEGLARMKAHGLLVREDPAQTLNVSHPELRPWGLGVRAFPLHHPMDEGRHYAFPDDWSVAARTLGDEDRAMLRLDRQALASSLRRDLGLTEGAPIDLPEGALDLGVASSAGATVRVVYVVAAIPGETERRRVCKAIAKAALPAHALVVVPRGRRLDHSLEAELDLQEQLGLASARATIAAALAELGAALPAAGARPAKRGEVRVAVTGERVESRTVVTVGGTTFELQDQLFTLLVDLASRHVDEPGSWADHRELGIQRMPEVPSRLRGALKDALPPRFAFVENRGRQCRLVPGVVVESIDWKALCNHPSARVRRIAEARAR